MKEMGKDLGQLGESLDLASIRCLVKDRGGKDWMEASECSLNKVCQGHQWTNRASVLEFLLRSVIASAQTVQSMAWVKVSDGFQTTAAGHLVDWAFYSWRYMRHILLATNNKRTKEQVSRLHTQEQLWKSYPSEEYWVNLWGLDKATFVANTGHTKCRYCG